MIHAGGQMDLFFLFAFPFWGDREKKMNATILLRNSYGKFMQNWIPRVITDSNTGAKAM